MERPRFPRYSRSASTARSTPILFRNLKQSATVFALEVIATSTPSTTYRSTPKERAPPENRTTRIGGQSAFGFLAFTSIASQTSCGLCVVIRWKASAERRQIVPAGTRFAASASAWCSVILAPAGT